MGPRTIAVSTLIAATLTHGAAAASAGVDHSVRDGRFGACVVAASTPDTGLHFFSEEARRALNTKRPGDARVLLSELSKRLPAAKPAQVEALVPLIAGLMAEAGMTDDALQVAALAPRRHADSLMAVVEAVARGEPSKADALLPQVMQAMEKDRFMAMLGDKPVRLIRVASLTGTLGSRGAEHLAWLAAEKDPYSRDPALAQAAEAFAKAGALELAMKAADTAQRTEPRVDAFVHTALGAVEANDSAVAERALGPAESALRSQKPDTFLPERLGRIALAWHRAGRKERSDTAFADAEKMAAELPYLSVSALAKVAASYGAAGRAADVDRLIALGTEKAKTDPKEQRDLRDFARQLTFADAHELALRAADAVQGYDQESELSFIIEDTLRGEKLDLALAAARKAARVEARARFLARVAEAYARAKEEGRALELAHEALAAARPAGASVPLGAAARVLAQLGRAGEALAAVRQIPEPLTKVRTMTDVAQELSWRGDTKQALAAAKEALPLADRIRGDTDDRDSLLSSLTWVAAAGGDGALARKLAKKVRRDDLRPDVEAALRRYAPPAKALGALAKVPRGAAKAQGLADLAWGTELADDTARSLDALCATAPRQK